MTGDKVVTDVRTDAVDELLGGVSDDDASYYQSECLLKYNKMHCFDVVVLTQLDNHTSEKKH